MPFEEISHTADWSLRVWAADPSSLFVESARGMNSMAGIRLAEQPRVMHKFTLSAMDMDSLLVAFLSELVYYAEQDHLAFDQFDLKLSVENCLEYCLCVELQGAPILSLDKAIKAVTYHNLQIRQKAQRYETEIVFDV